MRFTAEAYSKDGKSITETIEATDAAEAAELLRKRGLLVSEVKPARESNTEILQARAASGRRFGAGRRLRLLTGFLRQMSVLVSTGTPLVEAVSSLERQSEDPEWSRILEDLRKRMEEGKQLSEAMAFHPECFDAVCRNLVCAGETGGKLEAVMTRLAALVRQQQKIRGEVIGAMAYPCVLILISLGVLVAMIGFVLPRFEGLFKSLDRPVPGSTQALLSLSNWLREYWWAAGLTLGVIVATVFIIAGTRQGKLWRDVLMLKAPLVGHLATSLYAARIARVMGVLIEGRVALLECLRLVQGSIGNSLYARGMQSAEEAVTRGEGASGAFGAVVQGVRLFPIAVSEAMRSGERTGQIGPVLLSVADALDEDNEVALRSATRMLEPMILSVLGLVVGVMTLSMFLPLFDLAAAGGAGGAGGGGGG
ncbi:MAG: type II secretion system F family protein [Phycisphaerales bacterium]|nr:type II secretion system F family protein [Phycisphaerales bacterium]